MMQSFSAHEWMHYIPQAEKPGEERSILLELANIGSIDLEVLSATGVTVNLITKDGETLFVRKGDHVSVKLKVTGFAALEIVASGLFSYRTSSKLRWYEKPDPTPLSISSDESAKKPFIDAVQAEVARYMARRQISEELRSEISVQELLDDIQNGDDEFEPDIDEWGLPPIDMQPQAPSYVDDEPEPIQEQSSSPEATTAPKPAEPEA